MVFDPHISADGKRGKVGKDLQDYRVEDIVFTESVFSAYPT